MEKGNILLRDLIAAMTPSQRILVYNRRQDLIYSGYRAHLVAERELMEQGYEVKHIGFDTQFCQRAAGNKYGDPLNITQDNAGEYELKDIRVKSYIRIYLF